MVLLLEWSAEFAGGGVAVVVGPAGDGGHGDAGAEDVGEVGLRCGGEVVFCDGGDGRVADDTPGVGDWGGEGQKGEVVVARHVFGGREEVVLVKREMDFSQIMEIMNDFFST